MASADGNAIDLTREGTHERTHTPTHACTHSQCMHARTHTRTHINTHTHALTHTLTNTHKHTRTRSHTHTYAHTLTNTHRRTHTHTHAFTKKKEEKEESQMPPGLISGPTPRSRSITVTACYVRGYERLAIVSCMSVVWRTGRPWPTSWHGIIPGSPRLNLWHHLGLAACRVSGGMQSLVPETELSVPIGWQDARAPMVSLVLVCNSIVSVHC